MINLDFTIDNLIFVMIFKNVSRRYINSDYWKHKIQLRIYVKCLVWSVFVQYQLLVSKLKLFYIRQFMTNFSFSRMKWFILNLWFFKPGLFYSCCIWGEKVGKFSFKLISLLSQGKYLRFSLLFMRKTWALISRRLCLEQPLQFCQDS